MKDKQTILVAHIGGAGLSGVAEILRDGGHTVFGWERNGDEPGVERLTRKGIRVFSDIPPRDVLASVDLVVHSSIVSSDEMRKMLGIRPDRPVLNQYGLLNELVGESTGIAVTGSYGKTITTAILHSILEEGDRGVGYSCGGIVKGRGSNAKISSSGLWVVEAVETDGNCLLLNPTYGIVLNVEDPSWEILFGNFVAKARCKVFLNVDDAVLWRLHNRWRDKTISFGIRSDYAVYRAVNICESGGHLAFDLLHDGAPLGSVNVAHDRCFNAYNALAACAFAADWGCSIEQINRGLAAFHGVRDRFELRFSGKRSAFVTDIAHHPESIAESIRKCRELGWAKVAVVYRPHMYRELGENSPLLDKALTLADDVALLDIISVKDRSTDGCDARTFVEGREPKDKWRYCRNGEEVLSWLRDRVDGSTAVLQMGMYVGRRMDAELGDAINALLVDRERA